jgi:ATP-dependent Clp protease ATP-binding subunit ClpA
MTNIDQKIAENNSSTSIAIAQAEERCNAKMEQTQISNTHSLNELGKTLLEQLKEQQQTTSTMLTTILEQRDKSLINIMKNHMTSTLTNINSKNNSPTRKKASKYDNTEEMLTDDTTSVTTKTNCPKFDNTSPPIIKITNPYQHPSLRRRSVEDTLPATIN